MALLLLFTGSVFYLMKSLICGMLGGSRNLWVFISSLLSLFCVQTVPSQGETFFWYNGSMYYTGYFSVTLLFLGVAVRYLQKPRKYHIPLLAVLAAFLGGGNYVSLLQGFRYLEAWMGKWWLLTAFVLTPAFLRLCRKRRDIRFGKPVLVLGFLYGVFCSMSCPAFYTMNSTGPARAVAIVYYGFALRPFLEPHVCLWCRRREENWRIALQ